MADRTFITGGTGLFGSAILQRLLNEGREVSGLSRSQESKAKSNRWAPFRLSPICWILRALKRRWLDMMSSITLRA